METIQIQNALSNAFITVKPDWAHDGIKGVLLMYKQDGYARTQQGYKWNGMCSSRRSSTKKRM
jgi:hypothetical protein